MRLFVAGVLPERFCLELVQQLEPVRAATPQARWLPAKALHLTLVFLGAVADAVVAPLGAGLGSMVGRHHPLALSLAGMETFGPSRTPRVLATALAGEVEGLRSLVADARQVVQALVPLEPERPFRPHLTVARARSARGDPLLGRCRTALGARLEGSFRLEDVALVRSETFATGAVHTILERWQLRG